MDCHGLVVQKKNFNQVFQSDKSSHNSNINLFSSPVDNVIAGITMPKTECQVTLSGRSTKQKSFQFGRQNQVEQGRES